MMYISSTKGSVIAFIVFFFIAYKLPLFGGGEDINIILTVSTFLFAIIAGFYLSRLNTRYNKIVESIADEDANWVNIYEVSKLIGEDFSFRVADIIDKRYILAYDYPLAEDYKASEKYFIQLHDLMKTVDVEGTIRNNSALAEILDILSDLEQNRNNTSVMGVERLGRGQWLIVIILAIIIIFSLFFLRTEALYSQLAASLLSTATILVLLVMSNLQKLKLGGALQVSESGQEIFDHIGRPRYFNKHGIEMGNVAIPKDIEEYRVGLHKPGEKQIIKLMRKNKEGKFEEVN